MKKLLCVFLSTLLLLTLTTTAFAATTQKITVSAEKTAIREKASVSSKSLVTAKKGNSFTVVGSTKSYWKVEFEKKNDAKIYTGYILKSDTNEAANKASSPTESSTKNSSTLTKPSTSYPFTDKPRVKDPRSYGAGFPMWTQFWIDHNKYPIYTGTGDFLVVSSADIKSVTTVFRPSNSDFEILGFGWWAVGSWDSGIQIKASKRADVFIKVVAVDNQGKEHIIYSEISCQYYKNLGKDVWIESIPVKLDDITTGTEASFIAYNGTLLRWESSNPSVASIDQNGNMIAQKSGTAYITGYFTGDESSSVRVTIK